MNLRITKLIALLVVFIGALYFVNFLVFLPRGGAIHNPIEQSPETTTYRERPYVLFDDYRNSDRYLAGARTSSEIAKLNNPILNQNYEGFPDWAGYYAPLFEVNAVKKIDIDKDESEETLVFYSCYACDAVPRSVDIIKNNRIVFTAEGSELEVTSFDNEKGFELRTESSDRGYTKVKFLMDQDQKFYPFSEEDVFGRGE